MGKKAIKKLARRLGLMRPPLKDTPAPPDFTPHIERLEREIAHLREDVDAAYRHHKSAVARLEKLEFFNEHPDVAALSWPTAPFPSPAVSVVMPTWNREAIVGAAIRSVQAQTFTDWELLVIDDGSADKTREVVETFAVDPRIRYIPQEHLGQGAARNHALRVAKGVLVAYLDSDNIWYPEFLSAAVTAFAAGPEIDCAYGANIRDPGPRIENEPFDRERLLGGNYIDMSAFVHRRSLVERYGDFDERLERMPDWDLVLRYTVHAPARRLPVRAVRYRIMDDIRMTDTMSDVGEFAILRSKWNAD